jgi:hypothetical protein
LKGTSDAGGVLMDRAKLGGLSSGRQAMGALSAGRQAMGALSAGRQAVDAFSDRRDFFDAVLTSFVASLVMGVFRFFWDFWPDEEAFRRRESDKPLAAIALLPWGELISQKLYVSCSESICGRTVSLARGCGCEAGQQ